MGLVPTRQGSYGWALVASRITRPARLPPMPQTWEPVTSHGKRDFAAMIMVMNPESRGFPRFSG